MSFGGFIGCSSGGGGSGSGDVRLVGSSFPTASAMSEPQLVAPPIAPPVFVSLPLALKPKMEGFGEMGLMGENFDMGRVREHEYESRSASDNFEGASGDDQETPGGKMSKKKRYHRHTPYQINLLESSFKENPHPDEKARLDLGKKLGLESKQIKFWFQNRRTQMKTQIERHENIILKQENDKLRIEIIALKEAMRNPICSNCGGPAMLGEITIEEHHLRVENARLRDELNRICALADKFLGRSVSSLVGPLPPMISNTGLDLAVGRNGYETGLSMGIDNGISISNGFQFDKSMFVQLAMGSMQEVVKLCNDENTLWFRGPNRGCEVLNQEEYNRSFSPCLGLKPDGFISDATRACGTIPINAVGLVETLMDVNQWVATFPSMIGRASNIDIISNGVNWTKDGALHLIHAEFQVLSPLVPIRQVNFLRFCKQQSEGVWAIVDLSVDTVQECANTPPFMSCRRLPSGCIVQDLHNGFSKVTWIEHWEYDESGVHNLYRPFLRSGIAFGAQRWISTLLQQCECSALLISPSVPNGDQAALTSDGGRRSAVKLAQRMTLGFCAGVCSTLHQWFGVDDGSSGRETRLMMRKSIGDGEPPGIVLSATTSVRLPAVSPQQLFDFLRNEQMRCQWDILSHGGPMQQIVQIAKGRDSGNCVSLLSTCASNADQNGMLILQETSTDPSGSLVVYAAIDIPSMTVVMNGGDSSGVAFLPSGFAIVPDCFPDSGEPNGPGSLLTIGFQILVNGHPGSKLTIESVDTVNALIARTVQGIKSALRCN